MPQLFPRSANAYSRFTLFGSIFLIAGIGYVATEINRSGYGTQTDVHVDQPVPFSHQHHVGQLGIDCRYCHTSVEETASAGMPPTKTCMNCHSQIWTNAAMLEPVRASFRTDQSIEWVRVHDLPDFVYFNHSIHVSKGISCETCHGPVNNMPLVYKANTMFMEWCLECHRAPEKFVRPREAVFEFGYEPPGGDQQTLGERLVAEYHLNPKADCSICHR
ncbi:MAG: cytochrome c3 family protein [Candidatus Eisenbacteria bacterium]|nr:cytochrome c3 family protein [Candidatus Eisenbacteria bacterium]